MFACVYVGAHVCTCVHHVRGVPCGRHQLVVTDTHVLCARPSDSHAPCPGPQSMTRSQGCHLLAQAPEKWGAFSLSLCLSWRSQFKMAELKAGGQPAPRRLHERKKHISTGLSLEPCPCLCYCSETLPSGLIS